MTHTHRQKRTVAPNATNLFRSLRNQTTTLGVFAVADDFAKYSDDIDWNTRKNFIKTAARKIYKIEMKYAEAFQTREVKCAKNSERTPQPVYDQSIDISIRFFQIVKLDNKPISSAIRSLVLENLKEHRASPPNSNRTKDRNITKPAIPAPHYA